MRGVHVRLSILKKENAEMKKEIKVLEAEVDRHRKAYQDLCTHYETLVSPTEDASWAG